MNLLLWRHADAEDGFPDSERKLTPRGQAQARQLAEWINRNAPKNLHILTSPAVRCQQTAAALGRPFQTDPRLSPQGDVCQLLTAAGWPDGGASRSVLIVAHQPVLGRTAARVLAGIEADWTIKKGALWWLISRGRGAGSRTLLHAVIPPEAS